MIPTLETSIVSIKEATDSDTTGLAKFKLYYWVTVYPNPNFTNRETIERNFKILEEELIIIRDIELGSQIYIAEIGSQITGYIKISKKPGENIIESFYSIQNCLKIDVEAELLKAAFSWFNPSLSIKTKLVSYDRARLELYKNYGFQIDVDEDDISKNKIRLSLICMRKKVG